MDFPESEFWNFSLSVYGEAGVASACLYLQDERGLDVNLLLFCGWLGVTGRGALDGQTWQELAQWTRDWDDHVVVPLRRVRLSLKTEEQRLVETLRAKVGACEIDAEHLAQLRMEMAAGARAPHPLSTGEALGDVVTNLVRYLNAWGASLASEDMHSLRVILRAVFPAVTRAQLDAALAPLSHGIGG